jgi:mono/diheme cytochrome c family protein
MSRAGLPEAGEVRSTPEGLALWLASPGRVEDGVGDEDLACPHKPVPVPRAWTRSGRRGWKTRTRAWFRSQPFIPAWLVVLLPLVVGATGCGLSEPGAPPTALSGGTSLAVENASPAPVPVSATDEVVSSADVGARLYDRLCASCHGTSGDGAGPAARFLYPRPRNFRQEQFRMVSTTNMVPSDDDLLRTLERGMPGSSMFSFGHLSLDERKALVAHVRGLMRQGLEDRIKREAAEIGEEPDPQEMAEMVRERTQPGSNLELPDEWPVEDAASVARGRELYIKATCAACHGDTGKGDGVQEQKDELGMPIRPRDYTRGIFKGGRQREPLYARIALGVPGTPMPSSPALKPGEIADLVHYIRSLSDPATEAQVVHKRTTIHASRAEGPLPEAIPEAAWEGVASTPIVVSPLWWRDDTDPGLRVQALHDGRDVAIRLSWKDSTSNGRAIRSDEFPDMAAVQLFRGRDEPFLGMGAKSAPVEVWLWNAATQADAEQYADVDTTYPNMSVDSYPYEGAGDGPRLHATDRQPKDFLTAWAAGNQRSDPTRLLAGSGLSAEGPGSATLRPPVAQDVKARGGWEHGRWTVVLRRSMADPADGRVSVAFALWDGAARDRNGQKLVSIWHDLERP